MTPKYVCLWSILDSRNGLAIHPINNQELKGEFKTDRHSLIFTEKTMEQILIEAQLDFSSIKEIFHPHGIHIHLEYDGEQVEPASVSHNDTFANYRAQELGFRVTLTPHYEKCIACQHAITIKG
jgi:hypothetical protein